MSEKVEFLNRLTSSPLPKAFKGNVSESEIQELETFLGYGLPSDYREFLRNFGCGNCGSLEIYGVGIPPEGVPSLLWLLEQMSNEGFDKSRGILPVVAQGDGSYAALVCKPLSDLQVGAVVLYDRTYVGNDKELCQIADSFGELVNKWLDALES
jgi:antitoxin YobK